MCGYRQLSKILTTTFIKQLANMKQPKTLHNLSHQHNYVKIALNSNDYKKLFNKTYKIMLENYRFEYIYKTEIYDKIREGSNKKYNGGVLSEVRASDSVADLVSINRDSIAYEIKTEMDTNKRLSQQITSYSKLFEKTCVVTYKNNVETIRQHIPQHTGILVFNENNKLKTIRSPRKFTRFFEYRAMFNTLRKPEYLNLIAQEYGKTPNVPNTMIYEECYKLFCNLNIEKAQALMKQQLKKRAIKVNSTSEKFPKSVKLLIESGKLKKSEIQSITELILEEV